MNTVSKVDSDSEYEQLCHFQDDFAKVEDIGYSRPAPQPKYSLPKSKQTHAKAESKDGEDRDEEKGQYPHSRIKSCSCIARIDFIRLFITVYVYLLQSFLLFHQLFH